MGGDLFVLGCIGILFFFDEKYYTAMIVLAGLLVAFMGMVLNHRGEVKASGFVMLASLWLLTLIIEFHGGRI
jgi:hypothetical protein